MISTRSIRSTSTRNSEPNHGLTVNVVVDAVAVDQQQDAGVPVSQTTEAAHANKAVIAVVGDVKTTDTLQDVGQRAEAILLDIICRDDRD